MCQPSIEIFFWFLHIVSGLTNNMKNIFEAKGDSDMEFLTVGANISEGDFQIGTRLRNGEIRDSETHSARIFDSSDAGEVLSHVLLGYMMRHGIARQVRAVDIRLPNASSRRASVPTGFVNLEKPDLEHTLSEKLGLHVSVAHTAAEG